MIKYSMSLKTAIWLAIISIGLLIIIGYSLLSYHFFFRGMDNIVSANMQKALFHQLNPSAPAEHLKYDVTKDWESQPQDILDCFDSAPQTIGKLKISKDATFFSPPRKICFAIALIQNEQKYFVSYLGSFNKRSVLVAENHRKSLQLILVISLAITLLLIGIIWLLIRKVSQPISALTQWTHQLSPEQLSHPHPDFGYSDLNEMAVLIQKSLTSVNDTLQREQQFLKFTSHELRTPISVIRNNIELANKLESKDTAASLEKYAKIISRIDRASLTMKHLTETLLWLSRDDMPLQPNEKVKLDQLINVVAKELNYLLENKQVTVTLDTHPFETRLPKAALSIVLGNLIRNAFQHTWQGSVTIAQNEQDICIINHCESINEAQETNELGFGLGLQLTEALCRRLGWHYNNQVNHDGRKVTIGIFN